MAKGNTHIQLRLGTANAILTVIGFIIGLKWGVTGIALSYLIVNTLMIYPTFRFSWNQIELGVWEGIKVLFPVLIISTIMGIATFYSGLLLQNIIENDLIRLIFMVMIGIILYLGMIRLKYGNLKTLLKALKH
jgi:PST family polysaccharide transporter